MEYKDLATIQRIKDIRPHTDADTLELATVLGWQVVVKKGEFEVGDKCVFIVVDTIVPETPDFEFMRRVNFRVKPIRLRGEESAGLVMPMEVLDHPAGMQLDGYVRAEEWAEVGTDVTEMLGVTKYIKPIPPELDGQMIGAMPGYLIETDEKNLRTFPEALEEMYGRPYYITRKDDGTSGTYFLKGGEFGACGRTIQYVNTETNGFWRMARKYDVESHMRRIFPDRELAIQGEVVGPGIQRNHLGLAEMEFHLFNIFDINLRTYLTYEEVVKFCADTGIPMVPVIEEGAAYPHRLEDLVKIANALKYPNGTPAEGVVVRPKEPFISKVLKKAWSGKVLNTYFEDQEAQHKADKKAKRQAKQNGTSEAPSVQPVP
jgi:RNA ligase (TIGR02306 family)